MDNRENELPDPTTISLTDPLPEPKDVLPGLEAPGEDAAWNDLHDWDLTHDENDDAVRGPANQTLETLKAVPTALYQGTKPVIGGLAMGTADLLKKRHNLDYLANEAPKVAAAMQRWEEQNGPPPADDDTLLAPVISTMEVFGQRISAEGKAAMKAEVERIIKASGEPLSTTNEAILSTAQSTPASLAATAAVLLKRSPAGMLVGLGINYASEFGAAYDDCLTDPEIKDKSKCGEYANRNATVATATEAAPMHALLGLGKVPFMRVLARYGLNDLLGENATTIHEAFSKYALKNPDKTLGEALGDSAFRAQLEHDLKITSLSTVMMLGTHGPLIKLAEKALPPQETTQDQAWREYQEAVEHLRQLGLEYGPIATPAAVGPSAYVVKPETIAEIMGSNTVDGISVREALDLPDNNVSMVGFEVDPNLVAKDKEAAHINRSMQLGREALLREAKRLAAEVMPNAKLLIEDLNLNLRAVAKEKGLNVFPDLVPGRSSKTYGKYWGFNHNGQNVNVVAINGQDLANAYDPRLPWSQRQKARDSIYQTLVHEMHHALAGEFYANLSQQQRAAVYSEWEQLNNKVNADTITLGEWMEQSFSPQRYNEFAASLKNYEKHGVNKNTPAGTALQRLQELSGGRLTDSKLNYLRGFSEWMAEQGVRNAVKTGNKAQHLTDPEVQSFQDLFNWLGTGMKKLWQSARGRYRAASTFEKYIQLNRSSNELQRSLDEAIKAGPPPRADTPREALDRLLDLGERASPTALPNIGVTKQQLQEENEHFSRLVKYGFTLLQIGQRYSHVKPLQKYISHIRDFQAFIKRWGYRADSQLARVKELGREADPVFKLLFAESSTESRILPGSPEWKSLFGKNTMSKPQQELYTAIRKDFSDFLKEWEVHELVQLSNHLNAAKDRLKAARTFEQAESAQKEIDSLKATIAEVRNLYGAMRQKNYFPLSRFGKHYVVVRAGATTTFDGNTYRKGDVVYREHAYTKRDAVEIEKEMRALAKKNPNLIVARSEIDDVAVPFAGLPTPFLDFVEKQLQLSPEQTRSLKELKLKYAPSVSFRKHFMKRRTIAGWSDDGVRQYANYFFFAPISLAKAMYRNPLQRDIDAVQQSIVDMQSRGTNTNSRERLHAWLTRHLEYMMNPKSEFVWLRQAGFLAYLGFNVKSVVVNASQPLFAYAHLAALHGDIKATRELARAYKDVGRRWKAKSPTSKNFPYELELQEAISNAKLRGSLDESLVAYVAGVAEANSFERLFPGSRAGQAWQSTMYWSSKMFQAVEGINREVTFVAAWRLAKREGKTLQQAYDEAVDAVDRTQGEYARWNRPTVFRGVGSTVFLFKMFVQLMTHFMLGGSPGWWRAWLIMLALAGYKGLPFMENALDLADAALGALGKKRSDVRHEIDEFISESFARTLTPNAGDYFANGMSRNMFGLGLDVSGSLSMGRILPGTTMIRNWGINRDNSQSILYAEKEVLGPVLGYPLGLLGAAMSNDPNQIRAWGQALPKFVAGPLEAYDAYRQGGYKTNQGMMVWQYDPHDPWKNIQLAGMALNFQNQDVQVGKDRSRVVYEHMAYWESRKRSVMNALDWARQQRATNKEGYADALAAMQRFNRERPAYISGISGEQIRNSAEQRDTARALINRYGVTTRSSVPLSRHLYPEGVIPSRPAASPPPAVDGPPDPNSLELGPPPDPAELGIR